MNSTVEHLGLNLGLAAQPSALEAAMDASDDGAVFVLRAQSVTGQKWFYSGRHLTHCLYNAFPFQTFEGAQRKAKALNDTAIVRFEVIGVSAADLESYSTEVL